MREQKLTRRTFLGLGATAAVAGAAGLAGCAPAAKSDAGADAGAAEGGAAGAGGAAAGGNPTEFVPSFMNPPAPVDESKVTETVDVDVCVVGLGLAGVCALREAAESGAKTFGFDKGSDVGYRSGEFGTFGSEIHKQLGIEQPETQEVVNELMKVMGNRPNAQLLNYWIANSGPDLDWYIGTAEHELLTSDHDVPTDPEKPYVFPERFPVDAGAAEGGAAGAGGAAAGGNPTEFVPSFMNPPAPVDESKVTETVDVDVCVVGLGLAGVCALREAAESGAKTFGFDKGSDVGYRSGEFGTFGSEIHKQLGIEQPETQEVVNELMKVMGNRPNAQLLNYWIANSGPDLDWYIGTAEHELLTSDHDVPTDPEKPYVFPERFPVNENYNWREENYPCFPGMVHLLPDHGWAMHGTLEAAQKAGAEARFNLKGEQLIKEGDKVVGVYASDEDGNIVRVNAKKGVVLSCGDMSSDTEMLTYYAPQATKYGCFFSTMDKSGKPVNTGDGHKMAMWAGAVMEDGPYAPMTHSLGTNSVGIDPFLMVNQDGKRFANEDVGAQELQNAIKRQKGGVSYQIFDSKWKEQLSAMPQCFGGVTHYIPPEQEAEYEHAINHFAAGYASDTYFQGEIEQGSIIPADSIEELAKAVNIPADALVETVERYNELAHAGKDADFSKVSTRLFPVENPPYYAVPFGDSGMLVLIGGIDCDVDCRALDAEKNPVPGLFVAGNTMGGRFLVDYPVTVAGASHSMAMSFGRLAGRKAAEGK